MEKDTGLPSHAPPPTKKRDKEKQDITTTTLWPILDSVVDNISADRILEIVDMISKHILLRN